MYVFKQETPTMYNIFTNYRSLESVNTSFQIHIHMYNFILQKSSNSEHQINNDYTNSFPIRESNTEYSAKLA